MLIFTYLTSKLYLMCLFNPTLKLAGGGECEEVHTRRSSWFFSSSCPSRCRIRSSILPCLSSACSTHTHFITAHYQKAEKPPWRHPQAVLQTRPPQTRQKPSHATWGPSCWLKHRVNTGVTVWWVRLKRRVPLPLLFLQAIAPLSVSTATVIIRLNLPM